MVQVLLRPWYLFIESLGSYSRYRVSNGVMPCVMGPTGFNLKFWANILITDEHQNVVCSWWSSFGFIMIFIWVHHVWMNTWIFGRIICFSYEFLGNNQSMGFSTYIRKLLSQICLGIGAGEIKWIMHLHAHALRDCVVHVLYQLTCVVYLWLSRTYLLCFCFFAFHLLYCS